MTRLLKLVFALNILFISITLAAESQLQSRTRPHAAGEVVPVAEAEMIARAIAASAWGSLHDQSITPYYSYKDELIAYRFNWAVDKAMTPQDELLEQLAAKAAAGDFLGQWGDGEYSTVLMSARRDMDPLLERMNCLSPEYGLYSRRQKLVEAAFGSNGEWGKGSRGKRTTEERTFADQV